MKVNLPQDDTFILKQCNIAGDECYLVNPSHIGCKWDSQNLIFRSSIWTKDGHPVSLGLSKFFNFHEHPEIEPPPTDLKGCQLVEKLDGSCLILSLYKGQTIIRTRGTVDATALKTGAEISILKQKYPRAFDLANRLTVRDGTADHSLIFEWVGSQKIVLDYGSEPDMYLTAAINHNDYSLLSQDSLDKLADILKVKRPKRYNFNTIEEMLKGIEALQGQEGICLYYNGGQNIRKIKSSWYLALHSLKSNLTIDKLADLWLILGKPSLPEFDAKFEAQFDYECLVFAKSAIEELYKGITIIYIKILNKINKDYQENKALSRKDYAIKMQKIYQNKEFTIAMNLYLDKPISDDIIKYILLENVKPIKIGMFSNEERNI